jgi:hypothetical protein
MKLIGSQGSKNLPVKNPTESTGYLVIDDTVEYLRHSPGNLEQYNDTLSDLHRLGKRLRDAEAALQEKQLGKADELEVALQTMLDHNPGLGSYEVMIESTGGNSEFNNGYAGYTRVSRTKDRLKIVRINHNYHYDKEIPSEIEMLVSKSNAKVSVRYHSFSREENFDRFYTEWIKHSEELLVFEFVLDVFASFGTLLGSIAYLGSVGTPVVIAAPAIIGATAAPTGMFFMFNKGIRGLKKAYNNVTDGYRLSLRDINKSIRGTDERQRLLNMMLEFPKYVAQAEQRLIAENREKAAQLESRIKQLDDYSGQLKGE